MVSQQTVKHIKIFTAGISIFLLLIIVLLYIIFAGSIVHRKTHSMNISILPSPPMPAVGQSMQQSQNAQQEKDDLEKYLTVKAALLGLNDNMSLYLKNHKQNYEIAIDANRSWIPASTIKAYVALEAFRQRDAELINFDQRVLIKKKNVVPTELQSYDFPELTEGVRISIRELINAMITQSDNTAYNTLLDILDRRNISGTLKRFGFTDTVVGEKINLDDDQYQQDVQVPGRQENKTTTKEFAMFFNLLYDKKIPDSEEILSIFKHQKVNYMLPALLPENTVIAHKTGEWSPYYHDGGIIYKPLDPFTLVIFTNHDNPSAISELTKVAYFKNGDLLNSFEQNTSKKIVKTRPRIIKYLASGIPNTVVLGTKIKKHYVRVTAADLGITTQDLSIDKEDSKKIEDAKIIPGNVLYPFKKMWETFRIFRASTDNERVQIYADFARNRISEIKTVSKSNELDSLGYLFTEFNTDLKRIIGIIKTSDVPDLEIIYVKQLNDLLFATLGSNIKYVQEEKITEFVNQIYDFHQSNKKEITTFIKDTGIENPFLYEPILGTIKKIDGNILTLNLQDKSEKKVKLFDTTQVREFHKNSTEDISTLQKGSRIAVVGQYVDKRQIIPIFILKNIPIGFPQKIEGKITEINTNNNSMKVVDETGISHIIITTDTTTLVARDTEITIDGIKLGSDVIIFGEYNKKKLQTNATTVTLVTNGSGTNTQIKILSPSTKQ